MKTSSNNTRQHIIYGIILLVVVFSLVYLGHHQIKILQQDYTSQITSLQQDYTSQITSLQQELNTTQKELSAGLDDKQHQINTMDSNIKILDQEIDNTSKEYSLQIKNLSETDEQSMLRIQQLEYTADLYRLQIGELGQQLSDIAVESESFSRVISDVIDSVVSIVTNVGQGSGAIISSDGLVVTNYHVIRGASRASMMTYEGNTYSVGLVGYDVRNDIAVLRIISNDTFQYFDFGNSDRLKAGQKVIALGNPAGLSFTATEGIISSPSRLANDGLYYIQTDVTLNPGNSGGPLINSKGELIGIVNFKVSGYEGLGFAIPSNRAEEAIHDIISD